MQLGMITLSVALNNNRYKYEYNANYMLRVNEQVGLNLRGDSCLMGPLRSIRAEGAPLEQK